MPKPPPEKPSSPPLNPLLRRMLAPQAPAPFDSGAAFRAASQAYAAGRLEEAEAGYRNILAHEPRHADALYLLGGVRQQRGDRTQAESLFRQALAMREDPRFLFALAGLLHEMRRHPEAESAFRRTIELDPGKAVVHLNYGNLLGEIGRFDDAESAYRRALALQPGSDQTGARTIAQINNNLGNVLRAMRRHGEAEQAYRSALQLDPTHLPVRLCLAALYGETGRMAEAEQAYREAIAAHPQAADAHNNLGVLLHAAGRAAEAEQAFRRALALRPAFPQALNNLGNLLRKAGQFDEAIAAYDQAVALAPGYAEAHNNLGTALKESGRADAALASYRQALALAPRNADTHLNLACLLLAGGDFGNGWREYEYRWHAAGRTGPPVFTAPLWDGKADLRGKTIYLHAEQGFGDTLQFLRYATLAAERGATVLLGVPPELKRLAASCPGVARILTTGDAAPDFDFHCPLMSLPLAFGTTVDTIPARVPYLAPDADAVAAWNSRLGTRTRSQAVARIGLVWAGKPRKGNPESYAVDRQRSMTLAQLRPLLQTPGLQCYSLQLGEAGEQARAQAELIDFSAELNDFHDTAALIANLDLVISVDTAVAHLAGALGKPVWLLDRHNPCWRWLRERSDSPWYPSMRIFRQAGPGDWAGVVKDVQAAPKPLVAAPD
ncbi:MAG TPA: tetratricopeptide repeat protein [Burkholderiaceae bacterium]